MYQAFFILALLLLSLHRMGSRQQRNSCLINFNVLDGGGSVFGGSAITNDEGVARDYWTAGSRANVPNTLAVRAVDPTSGAKNTYFTQTVTTASKIAFTSVRDGHSQIFVMNADGSGLKQPTESNGLWQQKSHDPAWSPDGTKLVFSFNSTYQGTEFHLYTMNADGSGARNLQSLTFGLGHTNSQPAWSPDGTKIAFRSVRNGTHGIYVIDADGTNERRLAETPADRYVYDSEPAWSPDGRKIAFRSDQAEKPGIYTINVDGSGMQHVPNTAPNGRNNGLFDRNPTWTPDGKIEPPWVYRRARSVSAGTRV